MIQQPRPPADPADVLAEVDGWPADHAVAAVRGADGEWAVHGDPDRRYGLASVTKLLSAHAFLIAVEEGVFDLDEACGPPGATVRHLLAHASGVGFASREPERAPGERRIYSSAGFDILADAVAAETGMAFPHYLREATFAPLGMTGAALHGSAGHGGEATAAGLMRFADEILEPALLHPGTVAEALTVQFPGLDGVVPGYGPQRPADWGLGFQIHGRPESRRGLWFGASMPADVAGHFGQAGTFLWLHAPTGRACVVLTDRPFGDWAKPRWTEWNDRLWAALGEAG
ncbi:serine hydrolase domain-containing protein [Corynebacterium sphenisci]|uniref:serine hydrolase domain-containing protein n=1 Tax=Corynebacterium sphenisci TaxID=191493 RepID=UPI0026E0A9F3|nr:serine hydrolase domain-containing protein [Corynebacterium sphenisci]MDO5731839.1 serine hydrolase domain-containing protein [Corynebacterium sphenisci]